MKQQYHHGHLREALLDTAVSHLREQGIEKLSLRAVARALGVSQTAPYRHFKDKNALLAALATDGFDHLKAGMEQAMKSCAADSAAALQASGIAYVAFARANPEKYRLMFGPGIVDRGRYEALTRSSDAAFRVLVDVIVRMQAEGRFAGRPVHMVANTAWGLVHGLAMLVIDHLQCEMSKAELDEQIRFATGMLVRYGG